MSRHLIEENVMPHCLHGSNCKSNTGILGSCSILKVYGGCFKRVVSGARIAVEDFVRPTWGPSLAPRSVAGSRRRALHVVGVLARAVVVGFDSAFVLL